MHWPEAAPAAAPCSPPALDKVLVSAADAETSAATPWERV